jgi:hypothetical protein
VIPPVEARADREDDPVLGRRLIRSGRDDQARAPDAVGVELLDHDPVEQRTKLVAHLIVMLGGEPTGRFAHRGPSSNDVAHVGDLRRDVRSVAATA